MILDAFIWGAAIAGVSSLFPLKKEGAELCGERWKRSAVKSAENSRYSILQQNGSRIDDDGRGRELRPRRS